MSKLVTLRPQGLMTDQNVMDAPAGALRLADDVMIDRPGVLSKRPGMPLGQTQSGDRRPRSIGIYTDPVTNTLAPIVNEWDGGAGTDWAVRFKAASSALTGVEDEPLDYTSSFVQFVNARDNLYWTSKKGPYKVTSGAASAGARAGMHEPPSGTQTVVTPAATSILNNFAAAWRWCFRKIDSNNLVTRSAPSPWASYDNTTGATIDIQWEIPLPGYVAANDQIELYRTASVATGTVPSDIMFLAVTYLVTSTDVTNGYATIKDGCLEANLGRELYTNDTREGWTKANGRPPASVAMASYADCMWFGRIIGPWTTSFDIVRCEGTTTTPALTGLQRFQTTGDSTNTSTDITNIADTSSIKVGNLVSLTTAGSTPTGFAAPVTVTQILSATSVRVSAAATSTNVGATYRFHDGVTVDGLTYWVDASTVVDATYPTFQAPAGGRSASTARQLAYVISRVAAGVFAFAIEDPYYRDAWGGSTKATVVVRSRELDDSQWAVTFIANTTSTIAPGIAYQASTSGGALVTRDNLPHGLMYSKPDEPEHVPALNFFPVGNENDPVYAFAPIGDSMLVFKRDGIYRVSGSAPDNWRVDILEPDLRILRGECVAVLDGEAYAWTDRGVYAVSESGAQSVSEGAVGRDLQARAGHLLVSALTTGAFVATSRRRNLVLVGTPTGNGSEDADYLYVLNTSTGAWCRWTRPLYCLADDTQGEVHFSRSDYATWNLGKLYTQYPGETYFGYDTAHAAAFTTIGTTVTLSKAAAPNYTPAVGDVVTRTTSGTAYYRRITAVVDAGANWTLTIDEAFPSGVDPTDRYFYEAIRSTIQYVGHYVGPASTARAKTLQPLFDLTAYAGTLGGSTLRVDMGAQTDVSGATIEHGPRTEARAARLLILRGTMPKNAARFGVIMPWLYSDDIGVDWRHLGVAMDVGEVGERTER